MNDNSDLKDLKHVKSTVYRLSYISHGHQFNQRTEEVLFFSSFFIYQYLL